MPEGDTPWVKAVQAAAPRQPDSLHRADHHAPSQTQRVWIAVAILAVLIGVGVWLLVTNTAEPAEDDWPYDDPVLEQESGG